MLKNLTYTKESGKSSSRVVIPLTEPTEFLLALDVSEFPTEEQEAYAEAVAEAQEMFKQLIKELGLGSQYRTFKKAGIHYED